MKYRDDGFSYPVINEEECIKCNICKKVCPLSESKKSEKPRQEQECYYGWHRDADIRHESTSGGAFSAMAELILEDGGSVYGAMFDEKFKVCHQESRIKDDLWKLRQSKYVQSETGNCYIEIKERLDNKKKVLFCGTPCMVHGLRAFLQKDYEDLVLIDFICHGVTSPLLFKKYLESLEKKNKSKIKKFRFRDKVTIGNFSSLAYTTIEFENGKIISSGINSYLMSYMKGFMQRESCEECPYATLYRWSDITIGDIWGIEDNVPDIKDEFAKGISLILANSRKGIEIGNKLTEKMQLYGVDISIALNGKNEQLEKPIKKSSKKIQFYSDVNNMPIELALIKGIGICSYLQLLVRELKNGIKMILPKNIKDIILNIR
jgi:coenzyme F420-reducing hydrogenase beta subunit